MLTFDVLLLLNTIFLMILLLLLVFSRPRYALYGFIVFLPVYLFSLVVLYNFGVSKEVIRVLQFAKDAVVLSALFSVSIRVLLRGKIALPVYLDWAIFVLIALHVLYLLLPGYQPFSARIVAFRANVFFFLCYFLGRAVPLSLRSRQVTIILLIILGVATGLGAIFEKVFLDPLWLLRLGYTRFILDFYGSANVHDPNALPWTFWTEAAQYRRASAFFANPLDLAASTPITGAAIFASFLCCRRFHKPGLFIALCLLIIGLLLSFSRMATTTLPIVLFVIAIALGFRYKAFLIIVAAAMLLVINLVFFENTLVGRIIIRTLTFENSSSVTHVRDWNEGVRAILEHPLGLGLATSGQIAARYGSRVGAENQYVIVGVETGWIGLSCYMLLIVLAAWICWQFTRKAKDNIDRIFGSISIGAIIGFAFLGISTQIGTFLFPTYVGWWIIGVVMSLYINKSTMTIEA